MATSLPVLNLSEATFECMFGRGSEGISCQTGRPMFYPEDIERVDASLGKFLLEMGPEARALVEKQAYLSKRYKRAIPCCASRVDGASFLTRAVFFTRSEPKKATNIATSRSPVPCFRSPGIWMTIRMSGNSDT